MSVLKKYYRKPSLYVSMPSGGNFYNDDFLDKEKLSTFNEVGVMPMTTMNELMLNNPEALLNGSAIEHLIKDCTDLGDINAKKLLKCDVDTLLIAIKIASNGEIQEYDITCPNKECGHETTYARNLKTILAEVPSHEPDYSVTLDDGLTVHIRPSSFEEALMIDAHAFEEQKKINEIKKNLNKMSEAEDRIEEEDEIKFLGMLSEVFADLTSNSIEMYARCITKIVVDSGEEETDPQEILEWMHQLDSIGFEKIKNKLAEINNVGIESEEKIKCPECDHEWTQPFEVNATDFFVNGS